MLLHCVPSALGTRAQGASKYLSSGSWTESLPVLVTTLLGQPEVDGIRCGPPGSVCPTPDTLCSSWKALLVCWEGSQALGGHPQPKMSGQRWLLAAVLGHSPDCVRRAASYRSITGEEPGAGGGSSL